MPWSDRTRFTVRRLRSKALFATLVFALIAVAMTAYRWRPAVIWHATHCLLSEHAMLWPKYRFEGFFKTSTVEQTFSIDAMENCEMRADENQPAYVTPRDPEKLATLQVTISKDFDDYVFFPRVSKGSEVLVCENDILHVLFRLRGGEGWTPIGRRYLLDLSCSEHGEEQRQFPVTLILVLRGPWAQVWLPGGAVFFR